MLRRTAASLTFLIPLLLVPRLNIALEKPSLIVVTIDTLRADHVNQSLMPALFRLGLESLTFTDAVTVAPLTLPAHASLLTGLYPFRHGVHDNNLFNLPREIPTYAEYLKAQGYATAAFVSSVVLDGRFGLNSGFDLYDDTREEIERPALQTLNRAEAWLGKTSQPFFLWIHLFEPHAPYLSGSYAGEVKIVDRELARFFDFLRRGGYWDRSLLTVTSDHGESLGEHGEQTHGFFLYEAALRIPWILRVPGQPPRRFPHQVRIIDVMPTMLQYAGLPGMSPQVQGISLVPFVNSGSSPNLQAYCETYLPRYQFNWSELKGIRTGARKFIEAPQPELYDLGRDPGEKDNQAARQAEAVRGFRKSLSVLEQGTRETKPTPADPALVDRFKSLGYIGYSPSTVSTPAGKLPDPKGKLAVYSLTMKALELSEGGKPAEALEELARAEALDPNVAQVHFLKGSILGGMGRYKEAIPALQQTLKLNPRFVLARFKIALAWLREGDPDRAEGALQEVLREEPRNFRAIHNLAAIAYSQGDFARAEELEKRALAVNAEYFEAWNTLGAIYVVEKRNDAAIEACKKATRLNPKSGLAYYNLSLAYRNAGDSASAQEAAANACRLDNRYCK